MVEFKESALFDKNRPIASDIVLKFEDLNVSENKYEYLKLKINDYSLEIDPDWIMTSDLVYDEFTKILSVEITITIIGRSVPVDNVAACTKMLADHIYGFNSFYETLEQQFEDQS
ncbi:hypothetical protein [Methanobacterium sp. ACI-7]|uniref:hypothetical protein n=1 Tax=unclassified Methanobacterium TaxID=2627676 RepID=UPI0039C422B2